MILTISTIITVCFALLFAIMDGEIIKEGFRIGAQGHNVRAAMRAYVILLICLVFYSDFWSVSALWCVNSAVFWLVFDYSLNLYRGKDFFYTGKTAGLDRLFGDQIHMARVVWLIASLIYYRHCAI